MKKTTSVVPPESHALLDASVLAGATTGAVVGAMAGPPGAVLGGTIGAAVGIIAGSVLDREDHQATRHDRELDDAIGVTSGDLGARDIIRSSMPKLEEPGRTAASAAFLRAEHLRLEVIYERLLEAYRAGSWPDVCAEWDLFEPALRAHMDIEEREVFPAFREADPDEAEHLLAEHDVLRTRLDVLGVNVELHAVPPFDAEELIERLRAHRAREERLLYPWIEQELS